MLKYILLGLLALAVLVILVLLFTPVRVFLRLRGGELSVWMKLLWVKRIDLYPAPQKPEREPAPKKPPEEAPEPKPKDKLSAWRVMDILTMVSDLLPTLGRSMGYMLRRVTLRRCDIAMVVGKEEAADTAIQVGQIYALGHSAYGVLCSYIKVKAFRLHVTPDFLQERQDAAVDLCLSVRPSSLLMGGLIFLIKGGPRLLRTLFPKKPKRRKQKATNNIKVGA